MFLKWFEMSLDRIIFTIIYLTFQYWASLNSSKTSFCGSSKSLKAIAQWWFSKTDLSLYRNAFVCRIAIKNELFTPLQKEKAHSKKLLKG